ncbi:unnamed protein product [Durusdinium trenchii]|uniref:Uncharacterized protein n=1 Tax=Durusdinium trenchii TaxID=1381693 RepID=A0ABP0SVF5_9DINO
MVEKAAPNHSTCQPPHATIIKIQVVVRRVPSIDAIVRRQSHPKDFTLGTSRHPTRATLLAMSSTVAISGSLQKLSLAIAVPALMDQVDPILQFDEDAASSWRGGQPALPGAQAPIDRGMMHVVVDTSDRAQVSSSAEHWTSD